MKRLILSVILSLSLLSTQAGDIVWFDGTHAVTYRVQKKTDLVVGTAISMFSSDMKTVTGQAAVPSTNATIRIFQLDKASSAEKKYLKSQGFNLDSLSTNIDAFAISTCISGSIPSEEGHIIIVGSNGRGTAYGILELSRLAGVSPWIWWGDVVPKKKSRLTLDSSYATFQKASVEYRGIFLNDEDWTTRPWSCANYEPSDFGHIGTKTYRRIFELLLRLRANAIWPAMHTGTKAFFKIQGAKAVADSCGIVIGSSHCEPLLRNNVDEWDVKQRGHYNYITNKESVQNYWIERLKDVKGSSNNMFTIGMRGIHDGNMEGVKTPSEQLHGLQAVIDDQQRLLGKYIGDPRRQMQVFVPYKEVLQVYEKGLKVPDYVTLMWCDDNYGYMTRMSDSLEQKRSGGGAVYYHLSYWGRPHDYLWLCTTQPGLIYHEMKEAYDHNMHKLWIANVHDPKVAGYDMELYLDLAWNINCTSASMVSKHYQNWLVSMFGTKVGNYIYPAMREFWRLVGERKPEFMGWNQTELDKKVFERGISPVRNTEFTHDFNDEMQRYLDSYEYVADMVKAAEKDILPELKDAYFAAIEYPVLAAQANAVKMLEAQKARQWANGSTRKDMFDNIEKIRQACAKSQHAYQEIVSLTNRYNTMLDGKWKNSMNMHPRDLPDLAAPVLPVLLTDKEVEEELAKVSNDTKGTRQSLHELLDKEGVIVRGASSYNAPNQSLAKEGIETISLLGHSLNAVSIPKGSSLSYSFDTNREGNARLRIAMIPTQPNDKGDLRFAVSIDGGQETIFSLKEAFRSEQWKLNVLRGQAIRNLDINLSKGSHTLNIHALDEHIIIDQWIIDFNKNRKYYLFPTE